MKWRFGWEVLELKVSQILGITTTIAFLDTYGGSVKIVKSIQMVNLRRWLNGDGWWGGKFPKYWELQLL